MFKTYGEFRGFKADGSGACTLERLRIHTIVHVLRVLCLRRFFSLHEGLESSGLQTSESASSL